MAFRKKGKHAKTHIKARDDFTVPPAKGNKNTVALRKKLKENWR